MMMKKKLKKYLPFLWMGCNCLKATEPLRGCSLLFAILLVGSSYIKLPEELRNSMKVTNVLSGVISDT